MSKPDAPYFEKKLRLVLRDIEQYTAAELALELYRLASTANPTIQSARINELGEQLSAMTQRAEAEEARVKASQSKIEYLESYIEAQKESFDEIAQANIEFQRLLAEAKSKAAPEGLLNEVRQMRKGLINARGALWIGTNQQAVIDRDYPTIASLAAPQPGDSNE